MKTFIEHIQQNIGHLLRINVELWVLGQGWIRCDQIYLISDVIQRDELISRPDARTNAAWAAPTTHNNCCILLFSNEKFYWIWVAESDIEILNTVGEADE